jgi:hypothetical protein
MPCSFRAKASADPVLDVIRRELRRVSPDVKIDSEQIRDVLSSEVIKREVLEGDKADEARKKINRAANKALRQIAVKPSKSTPDTALPDVLPAGDLARTRAAADE